MTDNVAILDGYTEEYHAVWSGNETDLLVKPRTDLNGYFKAWDMHCQEYIQVRGWNYELIHTNSY